MWARGRCGSRQLIHMTLDSAYVLLCFHWYSSSTTPRWGLGNSPVLLMPTEIYTQERSRFLPQAVIWKSPNSWTFHTLGDVKMRVPLMFLSFLHTSQYILCSLMRCNRQWCKVYLLCESDTCHTQHSPARNSQERVPCTKINSKQMKDLTIWLETTELEGSIGKSSMSLGLMF